jgi:hypothetical protein
MLTNINPLTGWMLDSVVALDAKLSGFAGAYLRSSDERRQVIASYLAVPRSKLEDDAALAEAAQFLMGAQHRDILAKAFAETPEGLRGALGRSGHQPHEPRFYTLLHQMLTKPSHPRIVSTIRHSESLDLTRLRIIHQLPEEVCTPVIAQVLTDFRAAADLAKVVTLFAEGGLDRAAMTDAFHRVRSEDALRKTIKRWALKTILPPHPIPASDAYQPISTSAGLRDTGRRFRNCMAQYIAGSLDGFDAFAVFRPDPSKRGMIVHLERRDGAWHVEGLFGPQNMRPDPELSSAGISYLESHGVTKRPRDKAQFGPWAALGRFTSPFAFADEDF